jgi:hypothetical protein
MLKRYIFILFFPVLWACDQSEDALPSEKTVTLTSFNSVDINNNVVLKFDADLPVGEAIIRGNPAHVDKVNLEINGDVLWVNVSEAVNLQDSLTVITNPITIASIKLEADQNAFVIWEGDTWDDIDFLQIKTEANSTLEMSNLHALNVDVQQEAQSKVLLKSWIWNEVDSIKIPKTNVIVINDSTFLLDGRTIVVVESYEEIEEDGVVYIILRGTGIKSYYVVPQMNVKLEATSEFYADESPVKDLEIKLEAESKARVWVLDNLSGKGEGASILYLMGDPEINYTTQGEATIENF